jgi:hypothetical protein
MVNELENSLLVNQGRDAIQRAGGKRGASDSDDPMHAPAEDLN